MPTCGRDLAAYAICADCRVCDCCLPRRRRTYTISSLVTPNFPALVRRCVSQRRPLYSIQIFTSQEPFRPPLISLLSQPGRSEEYTMVQHVSRWVPHSRPCPMSDRESCGSLLICFYVGRRSISLAVAFIGAVFNFVIAVRLLALWGSLRWEQESEWEGSPDSWRIDPVKLIWGLLSAYFAAAASASTVGFIGIARVRLSLSSYLSIAPDLFDRTDQLLSAFSGITPLPTLPLSQSQQ